MEPCPTLRMPETGEHFAFRTSAREGDGRFRFTWTLAPGKHGPGEHVHPHETEHFHIVSGRLRIWLRDVPHDLGPGDELAVPSGVPHHFTQLGSEPLVADVTLDGHRMEDQFLPLLAAFEGSGGDTLPLTGIPVAIVHLEHAMRHGANVPTSAALRAVFRAIAAVFRLFGVRPLAPVTGWSKAAPG